jgi:Na+-driven multidrug efflux pump
VLACLVALWSGLLPQDWTQGFWWAAVVMVSVPAHAFNVVGTRLLVVARKQRYMIGIAIATAALNAVLDTALYFWLGPIGIVVATVGVRWIMAGVYLVLLRRIVPQTIGQELPTASGEVQPGGVQPGHGRHRRG